MAEVKVIAALEAPSVYSNHVIVEHTDGGTYRAFGTFDRGGSVTSFMPPHFGSLEKAIAQSCAWADEHDIKHVHVIVKAQLQSAPRQPTPPEPSS